MGWGERGREGERVKKGREGEGREREKEGKRRTEERGWEKSINQQINHACFTYVTISAQCIAHDRLSYMSHAHVNNDHAVVNMCITVGPTSVDILIRSGSCGPTK